MLSLDKERLLMVERQLARRGLDNADVLAAMAEVPREAFVPENLQQPPIRIGRCRLRRARRFRSPMWWR